MTPITDNEVIILGHLEKDLGVFVEVNIEQTIICNMSQLSSRTCSQDIFIIS